MSRKTAGEVSFEVLPDTVDNALPKTPVEAQPTSTTDFSAHYRYVAEGPLKIPPDQPSRLSLPKLPPLQPFEYGKMGDEMLARFQTLWQQSQSNPDARLYFVKAMGQIGGLLAEFAKDGHVDAISALHQIVRQYVVFLRQTSSRQPRKVRAIAEKQIEWPDLVSLHPDSQRAIKKRLKTIGLGKKASARIEGKRLSSNYATDGQPERGEINGYMERLVEVVQTVRHDCLVFSEIKTITPPFSEPWALSCIGLPDLNGATKSRWWKACEALLKHVLKTNPTARRQAQRLSKSKIASNKEALEDYREGRGDRMPRKRRSKSSNGHYSGFLARVRQAFMRRFN